MPQVLESVDKHLAAKGALTEGKIICLPFGMNIVLVEFRFVPPNNILDIRTFSDLFGEREMHQLHMYVPIFGGTERFVTNHTLFLFDPSRMWHGISSSSFSLTRLPILRIAVKIRLLLDLRFDVTLTDMA